MDQWPALTINRLEPNPSRPTHRIMGWGQASWWSYPKVMARSAQGHDKVKSAQNG